MNKITQKIPSASDPRAEKIDTRDEIRRHDPDEERQGKNQKGFKEERGIFGEDQTEISVASLETFLPMLLKNYTTKENPLSALSAPEKINQSNPNARAAGAYARMAKYAPIENLQEKVKDVQIERQDVQNENPTLSNSEIQAIHRLQADVVKLKAKGVQTIYIDKAGTFLESLQNGVRAAL